ncbi:Tip elongation aberrant protein 1 [Papilio xuthus]|uniref:Tip elongation aberrant protein 1 n=1 Tax=Papilio xuthus TaxID=66420 RepID=A0A194PQT4_PAPXU|nr:Tip elongation aberrant protein 1 [Papilio xuthus]
MWTCVESAAGAVGAAPCSRAKHSATLLAGHLYVLGGRGAGGCLPLRDFWRYSLARGEWERLEQRGEPPPALQEHSATAHGDKLYVFGGEPGSSSSETPLWIYDTQLCVWRKLPGRVSCGGGAARRRGTRAAGGVSPSARRGHSAHALDDCLLLYGGYMDLRGSTNELWAFHYESETWREVRALRAGPARHRHAAALLAGRLYVHGGQCDLRDCADLWHYDILSRVWTCVRAGRGPAPGARSGHVGLRAGAHFYIFGGEARGHPTNEMWRFHFATETWERMSQSVKWPSARVDSRALLVGGACGGGGSIEEGERPRAGAIMGEGRASMRARADPPGGFLREISKLSSFHLRRAARCSYSVLAAVDQDSTESLARSERPALAKSRSAYVIDERQPADGGESPRAGDLPDSRRADLAREPISVPDFADMILPTPVLSPVEAAKLVYLDSEDEEDIKRETSPNGHGEEPKTPKTKVISIPKSASVRFIKSATGASEDEAELSTSDYASAEKVNRISSGPSSLGFSNPHYLGPDVRNLGVAMTPDSGVGQGDIELQELGVRRSGGESGGARGGDTQLHLLLVGGKESAHLALLQSPLSMWTYRLL